jgi:molybdopterin synthase sulfur carrier subunit
MELLLFGITKDIAGTNRLTVPASEGITDVGALKQWLALQYPALGNLRSLAVAVDNEYAKDDQPLTDKNEIALIPPVSGG